MTWENNYLSIPCPQRRNRRSWSLDHVKHNPCHIFDSDGKRLERSQCALSIVSFLMHRSYTTSVSIHGLICTWFGEGRCVSHFILTLYMLRFFMKHIYNMFEICIIQTSKIFDIHSWESNRTYHLATQELTLSEAAVSTLIKGKMGPQDQHC